MKKLLCVFLTVLMLISSVSALAYDETSVDAVESVVDTECDDGISRLAYYVSGYQYGPGTSQVSYYVNTGVLVISGPTGVLLSTPVSGSGYINIPTQAGRTYTATIAGVGSSTWTSI